MQRVAHWLRHTPMTEPGALALEFEKLPSDVASLNRLAQGLLVHSEWLSAYGVDASALRSANRVTLPCAKYTLHENWGIGTTHPCFHCRGASAEFSPQPQYCPEAGYWFQEFKPFNGTATKDFGYQVTIKITPEFEKEKEKDKE